MKSIISVYKGFFYILFKSKHCHRRFLYQSLFISNTYIRYTNIKTLTVSRQLPTSSENHWFVQFAHPFLTRNISMSKVSIPAVVAASPLTSTPTQRPITICVEGNIGCGKTTLLNYLEKEGDIEVLEEPVGKWRNVRGMNLLELMYQDPVRWSHVFQTYVQLTMMQQHMRPSTAKVKVLERSIHSARYCFVENLRQSGKMSDPEYKVYCEWYKTITSNLDVPVDLIVYLSADPSVSYERIQQRGRAEEASIPMSYLEELHTLHTQWLESDNLPAPLLVLPTHLTLEQMNALIQEHIAVLLSNPRCGGVCAVANAASATSSLPLVASPPVTPTKSATAIK